MAGREENAKPGRGKDADRQKRLTAELRANLKKRKALARARAAKQRDADGKPDADPISDTAAEEPTS